MINTTPGAVLETMDVNGTEITINAPTPGFTFLIQDVEVDLGGLLEIRGDFRVAGGSFSGTGLEIFVGKGPSTDPNAIGILITNATIEYRKVGTGAGLYALYATGTVTLLGLPGLTVRGTATFMLNTSATTVNIPTGADDVDQHRRQHVLAGPHRPRARSGRHAEDRGHRERHAPPDRRPRHLDPGRHDRHHRRRHRAVQHPRRRDLLDQPGDGLQAPELLGHRLQGRRQRRRHAAGDDAEAAAADGRRRAHRRARRVLERGQVHRRRLHRPQRRRHPHRVDHGRGPRVRADGQRRRDRGRLRHAGGRRGQAGHLPLRARVDPAARARAGPLPAGLASPTTRAPCPAPT